MLLLLLLLLLLMISNNLFVHLTDYTGQAACNGYEASVPDGSNPRSVVYISV